MNEKNQASLYVGIPLILGVAIVISLIIATILEFPTNRGFIYSQLLSSALIGYILAPIPCCVLSILGIKKLAKLKKQGEKHLGLLIIGIINIVVWAAVGVAWWYIIFIGGRGV